MLGNIGGPHMGHNRNAYPYVLPPNYMPPTMHMPNENANHVVPVTFEGQQPWEHAQCDFDPYPTFTAEGLAFNAMPQPNTTEAPQPHPLQQLCFLVGGPPPAVEGIEKLDLIEERLRAVEGFGDYLFANMAELCLVPDVVIPPKFKVPNFDK